MFCLENAMKPEVGAYVNYLPQLYEVEAFFRRGVRRIFERYGSWMNPILQH